ncbi:MAG: Mov34/MPN/PAD-1 family protein [Verrucomicrobia bacterium]|nr:Mov34/MPN/PAD-1 family protein [Verrucomicrobiota bacterium]
MTIPVYLKQSDQDPEPRDAVYYLLTGDGLFINRQAPFFSSSVPAPGGPPGLRRHQAWLENRFPPIPGPLFERVVGFFDLVCRRSSDEAIVMLTWHEKRGYDVMVPEQRVTGGKWITGQHIPLRIDYTVPKLPSGMQLVGDIHSHGPMGAFESITDRQDQRQLPGLHIVVGNLDLRREPPDLFATIAVDDFAFEIRNPLSLFEGYVCRRPEDVPPDWMDRVRFTSTPIYAQSYGAYGTERLPARRFANDR